MYFKCPCQILNIKHEQHAYFWVLEILGAMVQLEYVECLHVWFPGWGERICSKVTRTSFVAIDSAREVTKSQR